MGLPRVLSLTNFAINDLSPTSVCFLLNCQKAELVYLLTLNLIDSLHQLTKVLSSVVFFRRCISGGWCEGMTQRIQLLSENRELDQHSFGAVSNPNLVRKKLPTRGTVVSRFVVTQKPVLAWWMLMTCPLTVSDSVPVAVGTQCS